MYCTKCGNTGMLLDGTPCDCKISTVEFNNDITMLDVPEQYQGVIFDPNMINADMGYYYKKFMTELYDDISTMKLKYKSYLICSPKQTSKTILAYSVLQSLFRRDIDVFPVYDALEIRKIMTDVDLNKRQTYTISDPESILTTPYLFVKIPDYLINEVYQTISVLIDRRTRRNTSTIFLYDGSLSTLKKLDYQHILDKLEGDGSYGTLVIKEFWKKETKEDGKEERET